MRSSIFIFLQFTSVLMVFSQVKESKIYVSDAGNFQNGPWQILKFDVDGTNQQLFTAEKLGWPQDIVFLEEQGIALISNFSLNSISRHNALNGDFIDLFATGIAGPTRMKIGGDSLLYVLQWNGVGKVMRFKLDGTPLGAFTETGVQQSIGLDWDAAGNLYVSSYNLDLVRKYNPNGQDLGNFISTNLVGPTNIWFGDDGNLFVSDYDGGFIRKFDANGKNPINFISGIGASEGISILKNGNILIGNGGTQSVKEFTSSGVYVKDLIPSGHAGLINPNAIVLRDEVNFAPSIEPQSFEINEESTFLTTIGNVTATDPNKDYLKFKILEGNEAGAVSLGNSSGKLLVADQKAFDFETLVRITLSVEVSDNKLSDTTTVIIDLIDIDENLLAVKANHSFSFYPNPAANQINLNSNISYQNIAIFTMDGSEVLVISNPKKSIDVSSLEHGLYILQGMTEDGYVQNAKLIISK